MAKVMVLGSKGGSGGREHALADWFYKYDHEVLSVPGNGGTEDCSRNVSPASFDFTDIAALAMKERPDLVVVGPEAPLVDGIVDFWYKKGLPSEGINIFGPRAFVNQGDVVLHTGGAMLEGSKHFGRDFAKQAGIPIPDYMAFRSGHHETNMTQALSHIAHRLKTDKPHLYVVKGDGIAGGKAVTVCDDYNGVKDAIQALKKFGTCDDFVLEQRLVGPEASVTVITDGKDYVTFPHSTDHKRRFDGDKGLNTGGMGAYAPSRVITPELEKTVRQTIVEPTIEGLQRNGMPYVGVLYFAIMVHEGAPHLIEYNSRFGDPETQVILPLVDADPFYLMMSAIHGELKLAKKDFRTVPMHTACIVACSEDYQNKGGMSAKGELITFKDFDEDGRDIMRFHAGTVRDDEGNIRVSGGRVIGNTALNETHEGALNDAYIATYNTLFAGKAYRNDIGR